MDFNWFQVGPIPSDAIGGYYDLSLVALSYLIAVLASYVALDLAGRLQFEKNPRIKSYWLLGGAFAMGAGIWSMHFIGMLAFIMPMPMGYEYSWTLSSLLIAIIASALALYLLRNRSQPTWELFLGGILIGIGIAAMHYMGMIGMTHHVNIRYIPSIFFLSILIAIIASEAALWLAFKSNIGTAKRQFYLKLISALVMGIAICGMHYTGMAAAIFTPLEGGIPAHSVVNPTLLALFIAIVTILIIAIALITSSSYKQMVSVIQKEKDFTQIMLNNLSDEIIACDTRGIITVCNNVFGKGQLVLNSTYQALDNIFILMNSKNERLPAKDYPLLRALNGEVIRNAKHTLQLMNSDEIRDVLIDGQPIFSSEGEPLGAVIVMHDVTELNQAEKLKKDFISIVSHELRTPLTAIKGSLALLTGGAAGELPQKVDYLLKLANNNTERLIRLINDILDMEKIEAGKMEMKLTPIDLKEVIDAALLDLKSISDKAGIHISFEAHDKAMVSGDYDRLIQVIINLLSNAIRFSSAGQTIKVRMIGYDNTVRVSIIDYGPGIPLEFQDRIFQKFSQADSSISRSKGGTGLGLSISKAIIERHGGTIDFESVPYRETCFYFELPKIPYMKKTAKVIDSSTRVLICDSNPDAAEIIKRYLNNYNISADIALSASEAREFIRDHDYDLITTDLILQDHDGSSFIRELRKNSKTKSIPVFVIATNVSKNKELLSGIGFPIVDWIEKPLKIEELHKILEYIQTQFPKIRPRILSVEDDQDISNILRALLEKTATIDVAPTLEEARTLLATRPYDLMVLDLKLPDGLGTDLLPATNCDTNRLIPILVFSAYELDRKYSHLVKNAFLKTKISNERLFEIIRTMLEENKLKQE